MRRLFLVLFVLFLLGPVIGIVGVDWQRSADAKRLEQAWALATVEKVPEFGTTRTLEVLPLINWHSNRDDLRTEPGVSYLIRTDEETILFDLGFNRFDEFPSPLEHNMARLGVERSDIDTIFISHRHRDHVGGADWAKARSFSFGIQQAELGNVSVYAPTKMTYPGHTIQTVDTPRALSNGIASTGPIPRRLFIGRVDEQALVVNLEGRGLVVIVGCGHQTVPKLLEQIEAAFNVPLYAIIGDLHYPVPEGRLYIAGIDAQRRLASGDGVFAPIDQGVVDNEIDLLSRELSFLALGGHDTHDAVFDRFENVMGDRFQRVKVGIPIMLGSKD
ncbi:MBL fold metallo-hydrolase [Pyruvatibacter mobilis]|uniref:MBL fold metallo-hydrolase n=1 Tax=Pyruvatibacter mobilis TaxID=1712261 RepID=UPI003C7D7C1F